jgi:hypothetical protein
VRTSAGPQSMDKYLVILSREVLIQLAFRDPRIVVMRCFLHQVISKFSQTTVVMRSEEVCAHTQQSIVGRLLLLSLCQVSYSVNQRCCAEEFDFPLVGRVLNEELLFSAKPCIAKHHCVGWEFPLTCELILENKEGTILSRVVETTPISGLWVNFGPVFTGRTIFLAIHLVSGEVIQIHIANIGVLSKNVFVEFDNFFELGDVGLLIDVVLVHYLTAHLDMFEVLFVHLHENWWSLNY